MRVFLLDLWLDLREKRLAPLAILLLAGIIAVPIVLAKGEGAPPPTPTTTAATAAAAPVIQSQAQAGPVESKLQTFSPRDPFEPTGHAAAAAGTTGSSTTTTTTTTTGGSTGSTGTSGTATPGGGGGGAPTGNGPTTTPGGTGNTGTGNTTGQTKTTLFTYTTDLRFGEAGDMKAFKDVKRLDLVPSEKNPKVVFLGVTTTGKTAVFLVDSNIGVDTAGGKCRPSNDECTFLYLRPDKDHDQATLTDADGTVYHIRLLAIHRVSISSANGGTTNSGTSNGSNGNGSNRSKAFTGSADSSSADSTSVPGGDAPPGEPDNSSSNFQQFFADGGGK